MYSGAETGSYLRLIDSCITQLKAQGPSRTFDQSKEEEEEVTPCLPSLIIPSSTALGLTLRFRDETRSTQAELEFVTLNFGRVEKILIELVTSDRQLKASREGSK